MSIATARPTWTTADELLEQLGGVAVKRLRLRPAPGTATERDLLQIHDRERRIYELADSVLVEKIIGFPESQIALWLGFHVCGFVKANDLGIVAGESGPIRLKHGLVRVPDPSFVSWDTLGGRGAHMDQVLCVAPELAVEVLSPGNTRAETARKVREYVRAGVRLVWLVDPRKQTVRVVTPPGRSVRLAENDTLDGGDVLPGFAIGVKDVFEPTPRSRSRTRRP